MCFADLMFLLYIRYPHSRIGNGHVNMALKGFKTKKKKKKQAIQLMFEYVKMKNFI